MNFLLDKLSNLGLKSSEKYLEISKYFSDLIDSNLERGKIENKPRRDIIKQFGLLGLGAIFSPSLVLADRKLTFNELANKINKYDEMKDLYELYYSNNNKLKIDYIKLFTSKIPSVSKKQIKGITNYHDKLSLKGKSKYRTLANILDLPYSLVLGLGIKETTFLPHSESNKGAKDLFQIIDGTYIGLERFYKDGNINYKGEEGYFSRLKNNEEFVKIHQTDPKASISLAYLSYLYNIRYKKNRFKALSHYNSGISVAKNKETKDYIDTQKGVPAHQKFVEKLMKKDIII